MFPILLLIIFTFSPTCFGESYSSGLCSVSYSETSNNFLFPIPSSRYKYYRLVLTEGYCEPDNYRQHCFLINGQFPGPPIFVNPYDFLEVVVVNHLSIPTTMHFHGILQRHTLDADGVAYVTQDPIEPGQTYVYRIQIEGQTGTYMYHGHVGLDILWIHGPFIIRDNPAYWKALGDVYHFDPGHEHIFQLESIFHQSIEELERGVMEEGFDDPPIDSLAMNGLSYGHWPGYNGHAPGYEVVPVRAGRTYRFRIINLSAGSYFRWEIEGHSLLIIEVDGILLKEPVTSPHIEINTGQRYSVLVTMNRTVGNYWISSTLMEDVDTMGPGNGKAILHYCGAPDPTPLRKQLFLQRTPGIADGFWLLLTQMHPNENYIDNQVDPFPKVSNRTILIDMQFRTKDGPPRFLINGQQFKKQTSTMLTEVRYGEDVSLNDPHVFKLLKGEVIDMVFQNRVDDNGECDQHPIHLHGHAFWILDHGLNMVDMDTLPQQLADEVASGEEFGFRDVVTLFPAQSPVTNNSGDPCGWVVIRFEANNPGLWLVHCHITAHMMLGKMFTLYEVDPANMKLKNE